MGKTNDTPRTDNRLWSGTFFALIGISLVSFGVSMGCGSGVTVYIDRLGGTAAYAGMLAGVFSFSAAIARIICSSWLDTRGRFSALLFGVVMLSIGTLGPTISVDGWLFALWRAFQGIGFSASTTAAATAAADIVPVERIGEGLGYYGLGQALGFAIGPAVAMTLVMMDPPEMLFYGFTIGNVLICVFVTFCRYEKHPLRLPVSSGYRTRWEEERSKLATSENGSGETAAPAESETTAAAETTPELRGIYRFFEPKALVGAIPAVAITPIFGFITYFGTLYGTQLGIGNPGLMFTASAISMIILRLGSKAFMDTVAPIKLHCIAVTFGILIPVFLFASGCQPEGSGMRFALYLAAGASYGFSAGLATTNNQSVAVRNTPSTRWGAANSLVLLAVDIGVGCGSIIWGFINDSFGYGITFACLIVCGIVSAVLAFIFYPEEAKRW